MKFVENNPQGFDILINNAGVNYINYIGKMDYEQYEEMISVNLTAPFLLINGFIAGMAERKFGRIVNISSIWSVMSKPGRSIYSATKSGLNGLTISLAIEYAKDGILVNSVSPGYVMTDLTKNNNTLEQIDAIEKAIPIGRMATVDEISSLVYYLASPDNTYITGQNVIVDGGYTLV